MQIAGKGNQAEITRMRPQIPTKYKKGKCIRARLWRNGGNGFKWWAHGEGIARHCAQQ